MLALALLLTAHAHASGLTPHQLGVIYNLDDPSSRNIARYYMAQRRIPQGNLIGVQLPVAPVVTPEAFAPIRREVMERLPVSVQSLLLVWSVPYAIGCMSITTAFAAGYRAEFCMPGCSRTAPNPVFNSDGWLPADTVGWWPAMLLPSADEPLARAIVQRGLAGDASAPPGIVYLVHTGDSARNVRAAVYPQIEMLLRHRLRVVELTTPIANDVPDVLGYFTGAARVEELRRVHFLPGAIADHLTSAGGRLDENRQMPATAWLEQGATASFGAVSEPCNWPQKFPDVGVLLNHYTHGETILESYWKSVAMPGQGLFIGEPLSRPYAARRQD